MNCKEFVPLIKDFTDGTLAEEYYAEFVHHARTCEDCNDELEINYMIRVGLEKIDNDDFSSLDIKGDLSLKLKKYEKRANFLLKRQVYSSLFFFISEIVSCGCIIQLLILWRFF